MPRGLVIAAPASGSGKTVLTLAILRALIRRGLAVAGAKSGPDYIDPRFHEAACGRVSVNLDAWAMDAASLRARAFARHGAAQAGPGKLRHSGQTSPLTPLPAGGGKRQVPPPGLPPLPLGEGMGERGAPGGASLPETEAVPFLVIEGAMGVLDGAGLSGKGSAADLAQALGLPVVLVIDAAKLAQSAALPVAGLRALRPDLPVAGVILNRVGSDRHGAMLRAALEQVGVTVFGAVPRDAALALPERHLGLVQARELDALETFLDRAAEIVGAAIDLDALAAAAGQVTPGGPPARLGPLGQRIAIAHDDAFAFLYPHLLDDWRAQGAALSFFSPLADEPPAAEADAVFLPGGYPELHAGRLAAAARFRAGMRAAADRALIYGECGGYMVLGEVLEDAERGHAMLGLLPLRTSFRARQLSLGYRTIADQSGLLWPGTLAAHEFHYATVVHEGPAQRLFTARDADGAVLQPMGLRSGRVCGSFAHVIGPMPSV